MTEKQYKAMQNALAWCKGAFTEDELKGIEALAKLPSFNYLDANLLVGLAMDVSRGADGWEDSREDTRKLLRKYSFNCHDCQRLGDFPGAFCPECSEKMHTPHRTLNDLMELKHDL